MSKLSEKARRFLEARVPALADAREAREAENLAFFKEAQELFESAQSIAGDKPGREERKDLRMSESYSWIAFSSNTDEQGRKKETARYMYSFPGTSGESSMGSVSREIDGDQTRYVLSYDAGLHDRVTLTRRENGKVSVDVIEGFESLRRVRRRKNVVDNGKFVLESLREQHAGVVKWQSRQQGRATR